MSAGQDTGEGRPWRGQSPGQRRDARRRRLLDAALELFGTSGYAATSLTALCAQAGVSPRHFYELYAGRDELMAALYDEIVLELARRVRAAFEAAPLTAAARVDAGLRALLEHSTEDPRRARVVQLEAVGHRRGAVALLAEQIEQQYSLLVADGQLVDRPFRQVAVALVGAVDELLVSWLLTEPRPRPADLLPVAEEVLLAVFDGRAVRRSPA